MDIPTNHSLFRLIHPATPLPSSYDLLSQHRLSEAERSALQNNDTVRVEDSSEQVRI